MHEHVCDESAGEVRRMSENDLYSGSGVSFMAELQYTTCMIMTGNA